MGDALLYLLWVPVVSSPLLTGVAIGFRAAAKVEPPGAKEKAFRRAALRGGCWGSLALVPYGGLIAALGGLVPGELSEPSAFVAGLPFSVLLGAIIAIVGVVGGVAAAVLGRRA